VQLVLVPQTSPRIVRSSIRALVPRAGRFGSPGKRWAPQEPTGVPGSGNPSVHKKSFVSPSLSVRKGPS
jgi:hypothetical protein